MAVTVRLRDADTYEVSVSGKMPTTHLVTVDPDYATHLTGGRTPVEHLVSRSFDFLLQREPNTSILRSFNLKVIGQYFPEYENVIRGML